MTAAQTQVNLTVPDRFEGLRDAGSGDLSGIIVPVEDALDVIDDRFAEMSVARRGSLMILRGETGAGKSTFLATVGLFRDSVITLWVPAADDIGSALSNYSPSSNPRIVVLEGREALGDVSGTAIEAAMHTINSFVRSPSGQNTLVVWPTNTDDLTETLVTFASKLGGDALLGAGSPSVRFSGPPKSDFVRIAEQTITALNEGASLAALGISTDRAVELAAAAKTIGNYLALIRSDLIRNKSRVTSLLKTERFRLWTLVIAGNEPEGDVAALTRGGLAAADIDRLMTATGANIVATLKNHPDQLGILSSVLDARIVQLDILTALAIARQFGNEALHLIMRSLKMSTSADSKAAERLRSSDLGLLLSGATLGTRRVGGRAGDNTQAAFKNLAQIASNNDGLLNRAIGTGLVQVGLATSFVTERGLASSPLKLASDIYCVPAVGAPIRIEVMWRAKAGRADIANYVLTKLGNYGKAIGLLKL